MKENKKQKYKKMKYFKKPKENLEAFTVDNSWSGIVIFVVCDNHLWECSKGCKDRSSDPNCILTLWWCDNLDLHCWWCKVCDFLFDTFWKSLEHGCTAGKNDVSIKILTNIDIAFHDGVEEGLVDTVEFETVHVWLEEKFWATETFVGDCDNVTIWKCV